MTPELLERIGSLEISIQRRIEGLLQGDHRGMLPGPGREAGDARPYSPGDDVRRIDWNVTARARRPYVRETIADHELETTLVVDCSGSMGFGTAGAPKSWVALSAAAVYGFVTSSAGNRVGGVLATSEGPRWVEPRAGRSHVYRVLGEIDRRCGREGRVDLGAVLRVAARARRRRGLVVVVSDFHDAGWERPLRALAARHEAVAVQVSDPREREIPDVGVVRMEDAETGRQAWVDTADRTFRRRFASAAAARAEATALAIRLSGAHHVHLRTDRDWLFDLVSAVLVRRRLAAAGGTSA